MLFTIKMVRCERLKKSVLQAAARKHSIPLKKVSLKSGKKIDKTREDLCDDLPILTLYRLTKNKRPGRPLGSKNRKKSKKRKRPKPSPSRRAKQKAKERKKRKGGGKNSAGQFSEMPYELLFDMALMLDSEKEVRALCVTNKRMSKICEDDYFWKRWRATNNKRAKKLRAQRKKAKGRVMELNREFKELMLEGSPSIYESFPWTNQVQCDDYGCDGDCYTCLKENHKMRLRRAKQILTAKLKKAGFDTLESRVNELKKNRTKWLFKPTRK